MSNNIAQIINDMIPSPESLYGDIGNHWDFRDSGGGFAEHPVCDFSEVGTYKPTSEAEEEALGYAQRAAEWAGELISVLKSLVTGGELAEDAAEILRDASALESQYGDDPLVWEIRHEIEEHFLYEIEMAEDLVALLAALRSAEKAGVDTNDIDTSLPTFGGSEPSDTAGIWSWDATHLLVGDGPVSEWEIVSREEWAD